MPVDMPMHVRGRDLPTFSLGQEELPEVRTWEVGGKYYLVVKVEMVEQSSAKMVGADDSTDKGKLRGSFEMMSVKALGDIPVDAKTLEEEDHRRVVASVRSEKSHNPGKPIKEY